MMEDYIMFNTNWLILKPTAEIYDRVPTHYLLHSIIITLLSPKKEGKKMV